MLDEKNYSNVFSVWYHDESNIVYDLDLNYPIGKLKKDDSNILQKMDKDVYIIDEMINIPTFKLFTVTCWITLWGSIINVALKATPSSDLTPKASIRFNPGDMKDHSSKERSLNVDGIFDINRLAIDDSFEEGKSLTLGLEYKKTKLNDINKFFEAKIASVYRDKNEKFIPQSSGINGKDTNVFGTISNNQWA